MTAGSPARPPGPGARVLLAVVVAYQWLLSPVLGRHCRYLPTCSQYAREAIAAHGAWRGGVLAVRRILRCHPWGGQGYDPVPPAPSGH